MPPPCSHSSPLLAYLPFLMQLRPKLRLLASTPAKLTSTVRIRQDVASGELTRPEAAHLKAREADIREDKQNARADGVVTRNEREEIREDENKASRAIYRQKHDGQEQSRTR